MATVLGLTNATSAMQGSSMSFNGSSSDVKNHKGAKKPKERNTIAKRNLADAIDSETLLWRALCDEPDSALEYMADDCVIIDPVTFSTTEPIEKEELEDKMKEVTPWSSYRLHKDTRVVTQIGLMSMATMCSLTLYKGKGKGKGKDPGMEQIEAVSSSVWRQTAGAEWELCSLLVGYAD